MAIRKMIVLALTLAFGAAFAAPQWATVATSNNGRLIAYVDLASINIDGVVRSASFKYLFAPHTEKDKRTGKWTKVAFGQETVNCASETGRVDALTVRYEDGSQWEAASEDLPSS